MPFRPKIVDSAEPPVDDHGELLLPDELAALGNQLRAESSELARRYRPDSETRSRKRLWARSWALRPWVIQLAPVWAGVLVLLTGWALVLWSTSPPPADSERVVAQQPPANPATVADVNALSWTPEVVARDLSGPEMEGMLDLLEQTHEPSPSVSF